LENGNRGRSQVLIGGAWDFCFLDWEREEVTTEDTEFTEKRKRRIGRGDLVALDGKGPPFANWAKSGAPVIFQHVVPVG
jgi:hypothetical protein